MTRAIELSQLGSALGVDESTGNVGIGTASPSEALHIRSTSATQLVIERDGVTDQIASVIFKDGSGDQNRVLSTNSNLVVGYGGSNTEAVRIKSTGTVAFNNPAYTSPAQIQTDAKDTTAYAPPAAYPANQIEIQNSVSMGSAIIRFRSQSNNASAGIWNVGAVPRTSSLLSDFIFQSRTADSTYSEIARISGNGNFGIGTNNPGAKLDVNGSAIISNSNPGVGGTVLFVNDDGSSTTAGDSSTFRVANNGGNSAYSVFEAQSGSGLLVFKNDGRLGIGTATPSSSIEIYGGDIRLSNNAVGVNNGTGPNNEIKFVYNGHQYAKIVGNGRDSSGYGDIDFYTSNNAGVTNLTQRMTIRANGKVGIGTDDPDGILSLGNSILDSKLLVYDSSTDKYGFGIRSSEFLVYSGAQGDATGGILFGKFDGSTFTENVRFTNGGNVGIGTTKPQTKLNVAGSISTGRNLAKELGTVVDYSAQYGFGRVASNVINGHKNFERGSLDWLTPSNQRVNAYVTIDLGASYTIDRLVVYNQNEYPDSKREVKQFTLQGSDDNSTWTTVIVNECGKSNGTEPNPGWSFRIPDNWADDDEGRRWRYWKFIMNTFHGTDPYGGVMEIELYQASDTLDDELSTSSLVSQDVYSETGNFSRGITVGYGYGGENSVADGAIIEGNVGIGTNNPSQKLHVHGNLLLGRSTTYNSTITLSTTHYSSANYGSLYIDSSLATGGFHFRNNAGAAELLQIAPSGNVTVQGNLVLDGPDVHYTNTYNTNGWANSGNWYTVVPDTMANNCTYLVVFVWDWNGSTGQPYYLTGQIMYTTVNSTNGTGVSAVVNAGPHSSHTGSSSYLIDTRIKANNNGREELQIQLSGFNSGTNSYIKVKVWKMIQNTRS